MEPQHAVAVLDEGEELAAVVSPIRRRILVLLRDPGSASSLAATLGISRQRANYHLRALEHAGLVELVEERKRRGCVERVVRATARSFVLHPTATGLAEGIDRVRDRFSSDALIASAARTLNDVTTLRARADADGRALATLTIEGEVTLGSPADLVAFGEEVARAVVRIADRYAARARGGRRFRFTTGVHQVITKDGGRARRGRKGKP